VNRAAKTFLRAFGQVLATCLLLGGLMAWAGDSRPFSEYQVKAVFLFNFARFVQWPAVAYPATNSPFVITIVGDDPFGASLDDAVREDRVQNHAIVIQRIRHNDPIPPSQILFIARSEKDRLGEILAQVKNQATLTVADTARAAEQGTMINLVVAQGSVKMEINQQVVESAGLHVSSKLLSLARIVNSSPDQAPSKP